MDTMTEPSPDEYVIIEARLSRYLRDESAPVDRGRLEQLIDLLTTTHWQTSWSMSHAGDDWQPYDRARALDLAERKGSIDLAGEPVGKACDARLRAFPAMDAQLFVPFARFEDGDDRRARDLSARLLAKMPPSATAMVSVTAFGQDALPRPFQDAGWLVAASPGAYRGFFRREDLLETPAISVEEDCDGTIWIQLYDDVLAYDTAEAVERWTRVRDHLSRHAREQERPY